MSHHRHPDTDENRPPRAEYHPNMIPVTPLPDLKQNHVKEDSKPPARHNTNSTKTKTNPPTDKSNKHKQKNKKNRTGPTFEPVFDDNRFSVHCGADTDIRESTILLSALSPPDITPTAFPPEPSNAFVTISLASLLVNEGNPIENLIISLIQDTKTPETRQLLETVLLKQAELTAHFSGLLHEITGHDHQGQNALFKSLSMRPTQIRKKNWYLSWAHVAKKPRNEKVAILAIAFHLLSSPLFCGLLWTNRFNTHPYLSSSIRYMNLIKAHHADIATLLHHKLREPTSPGRLQELLKISTEIEVEDLADYHAHSDIEKEALTSFAKRRANEIFHQLCSPPSPLGFNLFPNTPPAPLYDLNTDTIIDTWLTLDDEGLYITRVKGHPATRKQERSSTRVSSSVSDGSNHPDQPQPGARRTSPRGLSTQTKPHK